MITALCPDCWLYHAPKANCKEANAQGQAWLVKPPVDPNPAQGAIAPPDESIMVGTIKLKRKYVKGKK